jgi:hypothetical protein
MILLKAHCKVTEYNLNEKEKWGSA